MEGLKGTWEGLLGAWEGLRRAWEGPRGAWEGLRVAWEGPRKVGRAWRSQRSFRRQGKGPREASGGGAAEFTFGQFLSIRSIKTSI